MVVLKDGMMQCMKFCSFHVISYYFYIAKNCPINSFTQLWYCRAVNGELPVSCIREVILVLNILCIPPRLLVSPHFALMKDD